MAFSIKNDEADELLRELVGITGESLTTAVINSLSERLERERLGRESKLGRIHRAAERFRALPVLNDVGVDDVLQWDENGLPI